MDGHLSGIYGRTQRLEASTLFTEYGLLETIYSDGGPQFASDEFANFLEKWKVSHTMSSPHYPQSNGIAENAVKAMKKLLHCCFDASKGAVNDEEWAKAVMIYKNTPKKGSKLAPSEILDESSGMASPHRSLCTDLNTEQL